MTATLFGHIANNLLTILDTARWCLQRLSRRNLCRRSSVDTPVKTSADPTSSQRKVQALDLRALMTTLKAQKRCDATSTAICLRNRALLLVGFAGAFRRGELVSLKVTDVRWLVSGIEVTVQRSKTDQEAAGRKVVIPKASGATECCPVCALARWLDCAELTTGPLFRSVDRHGNVATRGMYSSSVADIVKVSVALAGFDASAFSGHSLRAGYVTAATVANVPIWQIKQVTGTGVTKWS